MSDEVKQVRIQFVADTSKLRKGAEDAKKNLSKVKNEAETQKESWKSFADRIGEFSPGVKKATDSIGGMKESFGSLFDDVKKGSKSMKLVLIAAVAAVAVKVAKALWKIGSDTARAFNAEEYDRAMEKRQASTRKLKTAFGAFTSPIVNGINKGLSAIMDGLTWVFKMVHAGLSYVWGFWRGVLKPTIDAIKKGIDAIANALTPVFDAIKNGVNAIANFFGFGDVFKKTTEGAQKASEAVGDVADEAEYAEGALQGFDKLNLAGSLTGDQDTADEINETSSKMQELGEKVGSMFSNSNIIKSLKDSLGKIPAWFRKNVVDKLLDIDWEGLWNGFKESMGKVKDWLLEKLGGVLDFDWEGLWNGFKETMGRAKDWLLEKLGGVLDFNWGGLWDGFCETMGNIGGWLLEKLGGVLDFDWEGLWNGFCETMGNIGGWLLEKLGGVLDFNWGGLWDGFKDAMKDTRQWVLDRLTEATGFDWTELWNRFKETMSNIASFIKDKILEGIEGAVGGVTSFISDPVGGITSIPGKFVDKVGGLLGLADGGVVKPNNPFPVIVGDNRREPEVISPISTMKQAFREAMSEMGGARSGRTEIVLQVDGKTLARAVYDDLVSEGTRRGRGTIA